LLFDPDATADKSGNTVRLQSSKTFTTLRTFSNPKPLCATVEKQKEEEKMSIVEIILKYGLL